MSRGWWVHKHGASLSLHGFKSMPVPFGLCQPVHTASASYHMTITTKLEGNIGKYVGVVNL
jgi:hypothetical protein